MKKYVKPQINISPKLEIETFLNQGSGRPGNGYGDDNHNHQHKVSQDNFYNSYSNDSLGKNIWNF